MRLRRPVFLFVASTEATSSCGATIHSRKRLFQITDKYRGTLRAILRQTELSVDEFTKLL